MGNESYIWPLLPDMHLMSTPRNHSRLRTVISSRNIDFSGRGSEGDASLTADDLRARAPLLGWLARLGYDGSVVFSCQGNSVLIAT